MPEQLALADVHTLQDDLIALYNDARGEREVVLDPLLVQNIGASGWDDDAESGYSYSRAAAGGQVGQWPIALVEGDRVGTVTLKLWQASTAPFDVIVYSVSQDGVRTSRGTGASPGASAALVWSEVIVTVNYTLPANETIMFRLVSGQTADKFGGGTATVTNP